MDTEFKGRSLTTKNTLETLRQTEHNKRKIKSPAFVYFIFLEFLSLFTL